MTTATHDEWLHRAKTFAPPRTHLIDGEEEAGGGSTFTVVSPRDGHVLADVADAGQAEVDAAVAAARRAFDHGPWPRLAPAERGRVLIRIAELLEEHRAELALAVSLEMGKPITDAHDIELRAVINTFRWYGQLADKLTDESPHTAPDALALVTREPVGVVGAVVPWNFPLTLAGWKVAPALAAGCTVVLKPSENSPLSALLLGRLALEAGLPPGVLNVVAGDGPVAGRALGLHPDVDVLAFTGSTAVGRHFLRYAADSNLKRVWLELGGKSPNIVLPDAPDLEKAAATAAWGIFFNQGEMCTAPSRLLVHSSIAEQVTEAVVARARALRVGDPLDPA
ncbi:aldehyde dehydrogenase family protein, partial [Streptomyces sp. G1]|uniref:aldehyde dehydrogenase family protein n=1 Tax=Streptomyces sp. G1 TaxID=361572 RepID=UPI002030905D